jgi:hypothetical protein
VTYDEWYKSGAPITGHLSLQWQVKDVMGRAAWNAALEEAAKICYLDASHGATCSRMCQCHKDDASAIRELKCEEIL